jgi:hypothetical protein
MNVKKSLENRIRGWLPREPMLPTKKMMPTKTSPIQNSRTSSAFFDQETLSSLHANELRPLVVLVLPILVFVGYIVFYSVGASNYSALPEFLAGVCAGSVISLFWTRQILSKLSQSGAILFVSSRKKLWFVLSIVSPIAIAGLWSLYWGLYYSIVQNQAALYQEESLGVAFLFSYFISYGILFAAMSVGWETRNRRRIYIGLHEELYSVQKAPSAPVRMPAMEKMRMRLGFGGGFLFALISILSLLNSGSGFFWWNNRLVFGAATILIGIGGLAVGILGLYGAYLGKKKGGTIMIAAGVLGVVVAPLVGFVLGGLLIAGGIFALLERPRKATIAG